ncbi:MAG: pyrroloquinoline quinone biosynthesis protein PqqB [Balneola sp.]|nr:MAG: pyrroloquinoline quinone biosynthesis protein PqqB [Balneola sp.]
MKLSLFFITAFLLSCSQPPNESESPSPQFITVLGIAQDAGFPQAGCENINCMQFWEGKTEQRYATSLGLVDSETNQQWMFEATPDFKFQLHELQKASGQKELSGIFVTHAHIGHYAGLMHLGREVMGANLMPVYLMPRMSLYLHENGPWSQLIALENISPIGQAADSTIQISESLSVTPFLVPHRDEFSETVGYRIESENKKVLFIPDINKWDIWDRSIVEEISNVDYAFLDATFFDSNELPGRDMSEIPHPFVEESLELFKDLDDSEKAKIIFIHFNHTNPLILNGMERRQVENLGYKVAFEGMRIEL